MNTGVFANVRVACVYFLVHCENVLMSLPCVYVTVSEGSFCVESAFLLCTMSIPDALRSFVCRR